MSERGRGWRRLARTGGALAVAAAACTPAGVSQEKAPVTAFAVLALSRGKGVPPEARDALAKVAEMAEADKSRGVKVETRRTPIGLEGETRLCVEYQDAADARRGLEKAEELVKDVDLVNLVPGPCGEDRKTGEKEEKP